MNSSVSDEERRELAALPPRAVPTTVHRPGRLRRWIVVLVFLSVVCLGSAGAYIAMLRSAMGEGKRLYESGDYAGAVIPLRRASNLMPFDGEGHYWLANALGFSGRLPEALQELREAVRWEPENAGYRLALGNVLHRLDRYAEAEAAFRKAVELGSQDADLHVSLGMVIDKQNRHKDAITEYQAALQIDPNNRRALNVLRGGEAAR